MKIVLRILNLVIMALAAVATVFLFVSPTLSFYSNIAVDVKQFSKFVPETEYTRDIDIVQLLGTDQIQLGISFQLTYEETSRVKNGDRNVINENVISKNIGDLASELRTPVELITDFSIRSIIKSVIETEVTTQIDNSRQKFADENPDAPQVTTEEIMDEVGMDNEYFTNFAFALYDAANADDATVTSASNVLYAQIDEALARAEDTNLVDNTGFGEETKNAITENLVSVLDDLKLIGEGGKLKKISQISYIYLSSYLKEQLQSKVSDPASLEQKSGESEPDYADRLLEVFVLTQIPDGVYTIIGYVSLGLIIGLFVFAGIWLFLLTFTLFRTFFSKKPWTFFGPWFWLLGILQVVLGIGLTVAGKFVLPKYDISSLGLPISKVVVAPRTFALVPSILFIITLVFAIVYTVFKIIAKRQFKREQIGG